MTFDPPYPVEMLLRQPESMPVIVAVALECDAEMFDAIAATLGRYPELIKMLETRAEDLRLLARAVRNGGNLCDASARGFIAAPTDLPAPTT